MCRKIAKSVGRSVSLWEGRQICGKGGNIVREVAMSSGTQRRYHHGDVVMVRRRRHGETITSSS